MEHLEINSQVAKELQKLLKIPLDHYNNLLTVLKLQHYSALMEHLDYAGRKYLSVYILNNALENETIIPTQEDAEQALNLITTLITDQPDQPNGEIDKEELAEEQCLVARFIHQLKSNIPDQQYLILTTSRKVSNLYFATFINIVLFVLFFRFLELAGLSELNIHCHH